MAAAAGAREKPQSSNPLDNFSFPILKRWGNQRMLRCANVNRKGEIIAGDRRPSLPAAASERRALPAGARIRVPEEDSEGGDDEGLEELRAKLMGHLREAADWIKIGVARPLLGGKAEGDVSVPEPAPARARAMEAGLAPEQEPSSYAAEAARPWNLRTRRAACKDPIGTGRRQPSSNPAPAAAAAAAEIRGRERTVRLRSESAGKRERPKFSVALTPEEIEEDIYAVTGSRPRRLPKKRPRIVQKQLDSLFPGLWLSEITADMYRVPDD